MDTTTIMIPVTLAEKLRELEHYPDEAYWRIIERLVFPKKVPTA